MGPSCSCSLSRRRPRRRQRTTTTTKNDNDDDSFINDDNFLENDSNPLEDNGRTVSESRKETFVLKLHREPRGITLRTGFYHRHHRHVNTCIHIYIYIQTAIVIYVIARTEHVRQIMLSRGRRRAEVLFYFYFKPWVFWGFYS